MSDAATQSTDVEPLALLESVIAKPDMMRALRTLGVLDDVLKLRAALGGSMSTPTFSSVYVDLFTLRHEEGCPQAHVAFERGRCETCGAIADSAMARQIELVNGEPSEPMPHDMLIADSQSPLQQTLRDRYPSWALWGGPLVTLVIAAIPEEAFRGGS